ncbi:MAG: protein kinase [Myxococcota bacterium]
MSDRDSLPKRLADRFVVEDLIGQGAMGQVFRVFDEHEGRRVALKLLKPELSQAHQLHRFKREFRAAARLDHPHCVRSYEFLERDGLAMLTMQYVEGGALTLERMEPLAVLRLGLQLLAGLDHIHGKRLVHRDLKPGNILIDRSQPIPCARLADFGIAGAMDLVHEDTTVGLVQGSLRYLAPETLRGGGADPRADQYSLGLILYALLVGQHPFSGAARSLRQWLAIHRRGRIRPLDHLRPDLPAALVQAIHRMCHREANERFDDAALAHDALAEVWRQLPDAGPLPEHPPLTRRPYLVAPSFVGRQPELDALMSAHEDGQAGRGPRVIRVVGEAGRGKSRLLRELLVEVFDSDTMIFPGTCRAEGGGPYDPLGDLLETLADTEFDGDATPLTPEPNSTSPAHLAGPEDETADLSIAESDSPLSMVAELRSDLTPPEDPLSGRMQAHARWSARLRLLCRMRPVMLIIEDAQWADPATLQLLTSMVRTVAITRQRGDSVRASFVITHRRSVDNPDLDAFIDAAREYDVLTSLDLRPLAGIDSKGVLASMLRVPPPQLPDEFAEPLVEHAEGNPLFLSQMLHCLLGRGQLQPDASGGWNLDSQGLSAARLPRSVGIAIGEQAARLATKHQQIMVAAAVLGRGFEGRPLEAITGFDELSILDGLDELLRTGFIEDSGSGYRFVHDRIRESIYAALPASERVRLHRQAAEHLVDHGGELPSSWPAIAHHFEHSGRYAEAYRYSLKAARHASDEHAHGAALGHYDAALRMAERGELDPDAEIFECQGDAHSALGQYSKAVDAYARCLDGAPEGLGRVDLLSKLGRVEHKRGQYERAMKVFEEVLVAMGTRPSPQGLVLRVQLVLAVLASMLPLWRWRDSAQRAEVIIRTRTLLSECYLMMGEMLQTAHHSIAAANLARRAGPGPAATRALAFHGMGLVTFGEHRMGGRYLARARAYANETELPASVQCTIMTSEALAHLARGDTHRAIATAEATWRRFGTAASAEARVGSLTTMNVILLLSQHDDHRCHHYIRRMQALAAELADPRLQGWAHQHRAYLLLRRGELTSTLEQLHQGLRLAREAGDGIMAIRAQDQLALTLALHGDYAEALRRGMTATADTLGRPRLRLQLAIDGGFVIAAALARRNGHSVPAQAEALVRQVLRRRRRDACGIPTSALQFRVAEAAWHDASGQPHDFDAPIDAAERAGLHGEVSLGRMIRSRFDERPSAPEPTTSAPIERAPPPA